MELSAKGQAFLDAWKIYDVATGRLSLLAEIEHKNGRFLQLSSLTLKTETDLYVDTMVAFAEELSVNHVHLITTLLDLRRDGLDHEKALYSVIEYINSVRP